MTPWIKIRADIFEDPRVLQLSDICRTEVEHTVGLLVRFWSWADRHTTDGTGLRITTARIDRLVNMPGFGPALLEIGWLEGTEGDYTIPRFLRHNGESAKARALESEAKEIRRSLKKQSDKCPTNSPENVRPEKRREEKTVIAHTLPAGAPEAEAVIDEGRDLPPGLSTGFPEKQVALDYAARRGWPVKVALAWWTHREVRRATPVADTDYRFRSATFRWWGDLEHWVNNESHRHPGQHRGTAPATPKPTINDHDKPADWTPDQMTLIPTPSHEPR
jgi:hypothetical protein